MFSPHFHSIKLPLSGSCRIKIPIPAELQTNSLCLVIRGNTSLQPGTSPQEDTTGHKQQDPRETKTKFPFQAFLKQEIIQYPQFSHICIIDMIRVIIRRKAKSNYVNTCVGNKKTINYKSNLQSYHRRIK